MSLKFLMAGSLTCLIGTLASPDAQAQYNITELGRLDYQALRSSNLSNLWGYTDEQGNEYAIVGVNGSGGNNPGGVSIVDVTDPSDPTEVFFYPGPTSIWREVKVYGDHAYITTEAEGGGLTIIDLSPLPQSADLNATVWMAPDWETSHSLFIDENGRLFIFGSSRGNGGAIMYDLTQDPMSPVEVGSYDTWYVHDGFARGDTLYAGHIYDGFFSMVDVSDPMVPVLLGTQSTPNNFTHNVWLDDSGDHLYTTDERTDSYVGSYDVSDPTDIRELDRLQSDPGSGAIPHNTYWLNDYVVTSYYTYGVVIYDASRPDNMVEVGHYDTSPNYQGDGFNGDWGVYPFFPSGNLICSDIQRGLVILGPTYQRACWLEGVVTNATTSAPVNGATVTILGLAADDVTGLDGRYATGHHQAGLYDVQISAPGYISYVAFDVALEQGVATLLDVQLQPLIPFALQGSVRDAMTEQPVPNAHVRIASGTYFYSTTADGDGTFEFPAIFADLYSVVAGQWGWRTTCPDATNITPLTGGLIIDLTRGYYDDFTLDLGWTTSGDASSGAWVRGVPMGTQLQGAMANPDADVSGDCGEEAYVTGNGGGDAGTDDVDGGTVQLLSPVFDATGMSDAHVRYRRWFYNGGGSSNPNDELTIALDNGITSVVVETISSSTTGASSNWQLADIDISDFIQPTATMRLRVSTTDDEPGNVLEVGLDLFEVVEMSLTSIDDASNAPFQIRPNPSNGRFEVSGPRQDATLELFDATGRAVCGPFRSSVGQWTVEADVPAGTYFVLITTRDGARRTRQVMLQH